MKINQTALQVIDFNFYGDNLIALRDNATGEVFTSINSVLKGIGFTDKDQIRRRRDKWINDSVIAKGITIFNIPTSSDGVLKNDTPYNNNQEVYCISQKKLPLALAKINITPKMKQSQPELAAKLELYQDKCADVLASVFINKTIPKTQEYTEILNVLTSITQTLTALTSTLTAMQQDINNLKHPEPLPKKRYSYWATKMFSKYQLLTDYFHISNKELYKQLFNEMKNTYPDIDLNQYVDDYCYENHLDSCYTLDVIEHTLPLRNIYESLVNNLLEKYNLVAPIKNTQKIKTIFDTI